MTRRIICVVAACVVAAVLTSCTGAGGNAAGLRARALPPGAARLLGQGSLYLLAGADPISANLWRVDLPSGRSTQLTFNPRQDGVSNFDASPAGLVMGDARTSVDVLDALAHRKVVQIGDGVGDAPQISASGQVAYEIDAAPPYKGEWKYYRIVLRDGITGAPRTIYRERRYGSLKLAGWSPDGSDIMIDQGPDSGRYEALLIITPDGRVVRRLSVVRPSPDNLVWGSGGPGGRQRPVPLRAERGAEPVRPCGVHGARRLGADVLEPGGHRGDRLPRPA